MNAYRTASPPPEEPPPPPPRQRSPRKPIGFVMTTLAVRDFLRERHWRRVVLTLLLPPVIILVISCCLQLAGN